MKKEKRRLVFLPVICVMAILSGCRGQKSSHPPILPIQNMVEQSSYGPQSANTFFKDGQSLRLPVEGTVAEGEAKTDTRKYLGREPTSTQEAPIWVTEFPIKLTHKIMESGQENYNVYCSPCHGYTGDSDGLVTQRAGGVIRPTYLHDADRLNMPIGKIYDAVSNGVNNWNMPGFAAHISVEDRWAVVAYVKALQASRQASWNDVPSEVREKKGWKESK